MVPNFPTALTWLRIVLIPVFVGVYYVPDFWLSPVLRNWVGMGVFALAAITDWFDGYLARRWNVESAFGKIADPLADRLMIDAAVLLLIHADRLPWLALIIPARDLLAVVGTPILMGRGYEFQVNRLGKAATWLLYASLGFVMVTPKGTDWPLWIFWTGLVLGLVALVEYALKARREVLA